MEGSLGFSQENPTIKTEWVDLMESRKLGEKGRVGQRTRVDQSNSVAVGRLDKILSNGHGVTSVRGNIWVIVVIHQGVSFVVKRAIWLEVVKTVTIAASPDI